MITTGFELFLFLVLTSDPQNLIFNRWTVSTLKAASSLERHMAANLSSLVLDSSEGVFYSVNPKSRLEKRGLQSGEIVWSTQLDGVSQATWTKSGEFIYGGDTAGNFYAVSCSSGEIKWKVSTKGAFFSRPLVGEKQIWVNTSLGTLQSYDLETGAWLWQQADPQGGALSLWSGSGPVLFQGQVVSGFPSSLLQSFDPISGRLLWKESFASSLSEIGESFNDLKSVAADSEILVASSYGGDLKVWLAQAKSKKLLWSKRLSLYAPVTISGNQIYLSARDGSLQSLELSTGYLRWKYDLPRGLSTQPAVMGNRVWVGTSAGEVYILTTEGKLIAKNSSIESPIWNPPVLLNSEDAIFSSSSAILRRYYLARH